MNGENTLFSHHQVITHRGRKSQGKIRKKRQTTNRLELAREATAELRVNRPYWLGDFYPLTKPSSAPEDWLAFQLHRQDLDEGIILAFRREQCFASTLQVLPRALNPDGNYFLTLSDESRNRTNRQISGTEMIEGLSIDIPEPRASLLVTYRGRQ